MCYDLAKAKKFVLKIYILLFGEILAIEFCLFGKMMMEGVVCRMFVGTWNVGGKSPNEGLNLRDWLMLPSQADIYVIGYTILFFIISLFLLFITNPSFEFIQHLCCVFLI